MQIIYMHHAERDITNYENESDEQRQKNDITKRGEEIAKLISEKLKNKKITAIYTSPYYRCKKTAEIINANQGIDIIEDGRFNEKSSSESWPDFLKRNIQAIDDIEKKYNDNDTIICITSGVNISAFICYFYKINPTEETPYSQALDISPVTFGKVD